MARAIQQIEGPYSLSKETLIGAAVPVILSNLVLDDGRESGSFATWLVVAVLGYLAVVAVLLLAKRLIRNIKPPAIFFIFVFLLAGFFRGAVIFQVGSAFGVIPPGEWPYRIFGSTLFILVSLSLVTVLVSNSVRATEELAKLETSRLVLEKRLSSMRFEISRMNSELAGQVSGLISPVIKELMEKIKGAKSNELGREVQSLRRTIDDVIRPLSQDVAQNADELENTEITAPKVSIRENFKLDTKLQVALQIVPFWSTALITVISTPAAIRFYGQSAIQALLVFALVTVLVLEISSFLLRRVTARALTAFFVQLAVFAAAGVISSIALSLTSLDADVYPAVRIVTLTLVIGLAMFIGQIRQTQRYANQQVARDVNQQLELLNSQVRRELWLNRRRIATVLHGPVQAALYASAMRLAQATRPSKKLIQSVNEDLAEALEVLKFESLEKTDLRDVLTQIVDVWSGTCEIYPVISKSVYQAIKKKPLLGEAVAEILREAISNAIKHGAATEIEVDAKISHNLIVLSILNNGKAPVSRTGTGFGSKLYSELTHTWSLDKAEDGRTKFSATIFIA
jgi:signal transduction histidine kinase